MAAAKPHLGFVLPSLAGGGAERVILSLAASLLERGYRIDLVLGRCRGPYRAEIPRDLPLYYTRLWDSDRDLLRYCREQGIAARGMTINPLAAAQAWQSLRRRRWGVAVRPKVALFAHLIAGYIRRERPRLLLSALPDADAATLYAAALTGHSLPVVIALHANVIQYPSRHQEMAQALYARADRIVACSRGAAAEVQRLAGVKDEKLHTIYNPVAADRLRLRAQEDVRDPWFQPGAPPVILSIGRESPEKDHATLVAAFGLMRRQRAARLVFIGRFSESYRAGLQAQARDCGVAGDLKFLDFDENPFRYLRRAALLALSSRSEALPMTLLEALACGAPVVSTDTPYGPREILEDGRWGKLTPVGDAPALAAALLATLEGDHPPAAALQGRAADFSPERAADAYAALFDQVAGSVSSPDPIAAARTAV